MFKKSILLMSLSLALTGCFGEKEGEAVDTPNKDRNDVLQHEDDVFVTNPVDAVMPIVKGDEFNVDMEPVLKQSMSEIKATRGQSGQAWDYTPYMDADKVEMFVQKDKNFHQDYPNMNLDHVRIAILGERCVSEGYPHGLSKAAFAEFVQQVKLRKSTASLVFIEQHFEPDMGSEQALQTVNDMRVWYRYAYDMANNTNALCSKVEQTSKDAQISDEKFWTVLKDAKQVGVEMARYAVSNEIRSENVAFCASLLSADGMIDNQSDLADFVISELSEKAAAVTTSSIQFPAFVSKLENPLLIKSAEVLSDMTVQRCLTHSDVVTTLALTKAQLDDPQRPQGVIDEGEVSGSELPPINLDELGEGGDVDEDSIRG